VLVTRGHQQDMQALLQVIQRPFAYLGMIGSRRRIRGVFDLLQQEYGLTPEELARVHAPLGLDIGAETPAEIAVAIMAEMILVRRGGTALPLSEAFQQRRGRVHAGRSGRTK
jgi:xanthine dehydrogenase accessory factor